MVIDTIDDVVLGDIEGEIVSTAGVAVRPFWWSKECLVAMGLAQGDSDTMTTTGSGTTGGGSGDTAGGSGREGETGVAGGETGGAGTGEGTAGEGGSGSDSEGRSAGGLSGGWIALITVLAVVAGAALAALAFLLARGNRKRAAPGLRADQVRTEPEFCPACGSAVTKGSRFCAGCGRSLRA